MEQNADYKELEEMRRQMAALKEKIEREEILSDQLLRKTIQHEVRNIRIRANWTVVGGVFVLTIGPMAWQALGTSTIFMVTTSIMMLVMMVRTVVVHSRLRESDARGGELLSVARNARRLKEDYKMGGRVGIPLVILWLGWLVAEVVAGQPDPTRNLILIMPILIGALVGGCIAYMKHKNFIRDIDDIIGQIEEK